MEHAEKRKDSSERLLYVKSNHMFFPLQSVTSIHPYAVGLYGLKIARNPTIRGDSASPHCAQDVLPHSSNICMTRHDCQGRQGVKVKVGLIKKQVKVRVVVRKIICD